MKIAFYLINLDGSDARLQSATQQLHADGVDFVRIPAVDGRGKSPSEYKEYDEAGALQYMGRPLKGGEMGCYFSHLKCIDQFLQSDADYVVVVEDDAKWNVRTKEKISELLMWLENNNKEFDIINIGFNKNKIYSKIKKFNGFELIQAHYFPMTTTSIIWSRNGAKKFREDVKVIYAPIDNVLREWQCEIDRGLATMPPIVSVIGAESDIDGVGSKRGKADRVSGYWAKRQSRLWRQKITALKHKFLFK